MSDPKKIMPESPLRLSPSHEIILAGLCSSGYEAYITGGAVRDLLLGRKPLDYDVVTNAGPDEIAGIFKQENVREVGRVFNVTLVNNIEVATYRRDDRHEGSRSDCTLNLKDELLKDLERRDLTINSMAFCPYTGELIDPYRGREDLEKRLIRLVGDPLKRILEDPVRIVRACRFASDINGRFEEKTLDALRKNTWRLQKTAPERLQLEVKKALKTRKASRFFYKLHSISALGYIFPSLLACIGLDGGKHHRENVFEHCMLVGDAIPTRCRLTKLTGYLHDVGKPAAAVLDEYGRAAGFAGHENAGISLIERDLRALKFSEREISFITRLVAVHMCSLEPDSSPKAVRKFLTRLTEYRMDYRTFIRFRLADRRGNKARPAISCETIRKILSITEAEIFAKNRQQAFDVSMLAVNGHDLMREFNLNSGPVVGKVLKALLKEVVEEPAINDRRTLLGMAGKILMQAESSGHQTIIGINQTF